MMTAFLITYHRRTGAVAVTEFPGPEGGHQAMRERFRLEAERVDPDIEIVSLNSDSLETIKQTHSRYFFQLADR